eukprot:SM000046S16367  [mRNA]  locus=s46:281774:287440:+ [translate_table: standard]
MADEFDLNADAPMDDALDDGGDDGGGGAGDAEAYTPHKEGEEKELTSDGGVKKLLVKAGEGWEKPDSGDDVSVHYTGTLLDGTKFDSSVDRGQPFTFKLGQGQVIKGWDKGVATMKKGEKATFTIAPQYAYGEAGSPPTIPANATLKFDVELLSWTSVKDITGDGGLVKTIVTEGKAWQMPKDDDQVTIKYEAKLPDGTVIAKSPEEGQEFYVKDGHLFPGIARALKTMHKGEEVLLTVRSDYAFGEAGKEATDGGVAVPPNATIMVDLELVSWNVVEKITDDGKVLKKVLKEGEGYEKPNDGAQVKVRYTARLEDGTVVEKLGFDENEYEFVVDEEQVIPGLDKAVMQMKKGEVALVTIAPEYAYGSPGLQKEGMTVPPNATLHYEIEMVSFIKDKETWEVSETKDKLERTATLKEDGNQLYKAGKFSRASKKYSKAMKFVEYDSQFSDEEKKQSKALKLSCYLNDAACRLKLKDYNEAVKLCCKAVDLESQNVKALFRRAQGYVGTQDYDLAELDLKKALEIDPENRDVKLEMKELKRRQVEQNKKEAKIFGNMFSRLSKLEERENKGKGLAVPAEANGHTLIDEDMGDAKATEAPNDDSTEARIVEQPPIST